MYPTGGETGFVRDRDEECLMLVFLYVFHDMRGQYRLHILHSEWLVPQFYNSYLNPKIT